MGCKQPYITSFFESIIRFHNYANYSGSRTDEKFIKQTVLQNPNILYKAEKLQVYNEGFFNRELVLFGGEITLLNTRSPLKKPFEQEAET